MFRYFIVMGIGIAGRAWCFTELSEAMNTVCTLLLMIVSLLLIDGEKESRGK